MRTTLTLFLIFFASIAFGQSKDEQLYNAVSVQDTLLTAKLLNEGANPNFKKRVMTFEISALILSIQNKDWTDARLLIMHNAEVDWKDWFNTTALMYAADFGNLPTVKLLIAHGADAIAHDEQGNSVLSAAKESKNPEVIILIQSLQKN